MMVCNRGIQLLLATSLLAHVTKAESKKVVFIPMAQASHVRSHINLAEELSKLGHQTWVCIPDVFVGLVSVHPLSVQVLSYGDSVKDVGEVILANSGVMDNFWSGRGQDIFVIHKISMISWESLMDTLSDVRFWTGIQNIQPDLVVLDWTPFCRTMLAVPYKLDIPFAFFGTYLDAANARVPYTAACNPEILSDLDDRMTFMERVENTLLHLLFLACNPFCDDSILQKFVPEKPPISVNRLAAKAEIFIVESDHILDYSRPTLPNTKLVGGFAAKPPKSLTGIFKEFVDKSSHGIIVVTFGSTVVNIPDHISQKMLSAFQQLKLNVIWRQNLTSPNPEQILTSDWIPQNDLLANNGTHMFVSHCGANGQYEALYHGVPILCLPLFADQFYNSRRIVNKGFGLRADIRLVSENDLVKLIEKVAFSETFKKNIKKASEIFRLLYKEPQKEAAFWVNHVLTFGGAHLRFAGQEMPMYQFLLLDVITGISVVLLVVTFCFVKGLVRLFRFVRALYRRKLKRH